MRHKQHPKAPASCHVLLCFCFSFLLQQAKHSRAKYCPHKPVTFSHWDILFLSTSSIELNKNVIINFAIEIWAREAAEGAQMISNLPLGSNRDKATVSGSYITRIRNQLFAKLVKCPVIEDNNKQSVSLQLGKSPSRVGIYWRISPHLPYHQEVCVFAYFVMMWIGWVRMRNMTPHYWSIIVEWLLWEISVPIDGRRNGEK